MRIESTSNDRIKAVRRLRRGRERRRTGRTIAEGPTLVEAALVGGIVPDEVYTVDPGPLIRRCEAVGSQVVEVSRDILGAIATTVEPQDPIAVVSVPRSADLAVRRTLVAVDIADPGNLGTMIRTAAAFDWQMALIGGADPWNPKVLRSSSGAQLTNPAIPIDSLDRLDDIGLAPVATTVAGGTLPRLVDEPSPIALVVGNEAQGLPAEIIKRCAATVTIPMPGGFESLNAAVAAAVAMYALDEGRAE